MPDPKKNPLLGAFRSDPPKEEKKPAEPPKEDKTPAMAPAAHVKPPETTKAPVPGKTDTPPWEEKPKDDKTPAKAGEEKKPSEPPKTAEDKKPAEQGKETKDGKAPTPAKAGEEKKPTEPPKTAEDKKPAEQGKETKDGKTTATPAKADEKKPSEPPKTAEDKKPTEQGKEAKDGKAPTPAKAGEEKKPAEQGKEAKDSKTPSTPAKAGEEKKPAEPPKATEDKKPAEQGKDTKDGKATAAPAKTGEEKKPAEPPKATEDKKPAEELDEDGVPKDFSMKIVGEDELGKVTMLAISYIDQFEGHPFPVRDDDDMAALVKSIKQVGILEPATVIRNPKKFGRFEMVAGHRRMHAAKLAGLTHIPVIIRDMDHDEATIYMVDSNLKREIPLTTMEKARAYTMRSEALKRKTGRRSKEEQKILEATGQKPKTADEQIAEQTGESVATVQRIKTLTKLDPNLQKMVDKKELPISTAADIAQLKPTEQAALADEIEKQGGTVPSGTKAKQMKEESRAGTLTKEKIEASVAPTKRELDPPLKVTLNDEDLRPYFPKGATIPDVKRGIFEALDLRKKAMEKQKAKAQAEKDAKKKPPAPAR